MKEEADWKLTKKPSIVYNNKHIMLMKVWQYIKFATHKNSTAKLFYWSAIS